MAEYQSSQSKLKKRLMDLETFKEKQHLPHQPDVFSPDTNYIVVKPEVTSLSGTQQCALRVLMSAVMTGDIRVESC